MASVDELNRAQRAERRYPISASNNAPLWIGGIVVVAAIIGLFVYGFGPPHPSVGTVPTHDASQAPAPPAVHP